DQLDRDTAGVGRFDRGEHLGAGLDAEAGGDPALVRREPEVGEQVQRAALAHHLDHVEVAKCIGLGQRLVPRPIELDAHRVGTDPGDHLPDLIDAALRHVRGPDDVKRRIPRNKLGHRHGADIARALRYTQCMATPIPEATRVEIEAAAFRRLVEHFRERTDVQNLDVMNLAGFCRNCLSKWVRAAATERGVPLSDPEAREMIYGMPYDEWKAKYQK